MRILIIDNMTTPGAGSHTASLLSGAGHDARVVSPAPVRRGPRGTVSHIFGHDTDMRVLDTWRADIVHVFDVSPRPASPFMHAAARRGIPVFRTMADYTALCPAGRCRTPEGDICEDCLHGRRRVMTRKCVDRDAFGSFVGLMRLLYWDARRMQQSAGTFLATSAFMRSKMLEAGFSTTRVVTVPLPVPAADSGRNRSDYFCYCGPLTPDSGVETLAEAAVNSGCRTVIAGRGPLRGRLEQLSRRTPVLTLLDTDASCHPSLLCEAKAVVVPSESYLCDENLLKQALRAGTPVIAASMASLTEMVSEPDGVLFDAGNREQLATVMREFDKRHAFRHSEIAGRADARYSDETYLKKLLSLYGN